MENNNRKNYSSLVDVALIAGIVYLASQGKDGWGWLLLILMLKNC